MFHNTEAKQHERAQSNTNYTAQHTQSLHSRSEGNSKCNQTMQTIQRNQTFFFLSNKKVHLFFSVLPWWDWLSSGEMSFECLVGSCYGERTNQTEAEPGGYPRQIGGDTGEAAEVGCDPAPAVMWLCWSLGSEPKRHVWASHILMFLSPLSTTHSFSLPNPPAIVQNSP